MYIRNQTVKIVKLTSMRAFLFALLQLSFFQLSTQDQNASTVFCSPIALHGYYPLYVSEECAAAASPSLGTATAHQCSGNSCDYEDFKSPCSDGLYTPKDECLRGVCRRSWQSTCVESRVVKQTYFQMGTCSVAGYDSTEGGTESICHSRGGTWTWPASEAACRDAAAKHHYSYFSTCSVCNENYRCLVSNVGIGTYVINSWRSCHVFAPTTCSDCYLYTNASTCNDQPDKVWDTSFTYDSSQELTTLWFPDGLQLGKEIFYGTYNPEKGLDGATGPQGPQGPAGPQGIQGPRGERGVRGFNGTQGEKGDSPYKGAFDAAKAAVYAYHVGDIVTFNNGLYHLTDRLKQSEPGSTDSEGWQSMRGEKGERADPLYRGQFQQSIANALGYKISDIVMMPDGNLYQLTSLLNQNEVGQPDSDGWNYMRGQQGIQGEKGDPGPAGPAGGPAGPTGPQGVAGPKGDKGDSLFKGTFSSSTAAILGYEVGDIVLMPDGKFYQLSNRLNQEEIGLPDSSGWQPMQGERGERGESVFKGVYDPSKVYVDGDVVRSSVNGNLYQLVGQDTGGYPELASSTHWVVLSGPKGDTGNAGRNGTDGKDGFDGRNGTDGKDGRNGLDGRNGTDGMRGATGLAGRNGTDGKDGHSNWQGIYDLNRNPEYRRGDIVEFNDQLWALLEDQSGGLPGQDSAWISLIGVPGLDGRDGTNGVDGEDNGTAIGWVILISVVAALLVGSVFVVVYYFVLRPRDEKGTRRDIQGVGNNFMSEPKSNYYYALHG